MGGEYPSGYEFNFFGYNISAAAHVVATWPGRITFSGFEMGKNVFSGAELTTRGPANDPVKAAYRWYSGYNNSRESWDPLTMLYAIYGLGDIFAYGNKCGYNLVYPNGTNVWQLGKKADGIHHYLKLKISPPLAGALLDQLYLKGAATSASAIDSFPQYRLINNAA
ncbi:hypothetical protein QQS21_005713 [Conoideocrella luteorostrata]|uniref:Uncharacterized protein n=1 Tax=Conoideocrella luteorostrata TaxID=1105319 RepID=A0AAJ0FYW8_9HYPO|nr:hypothetical protein QQS21_005713 [Conoideocrella luteorostrata]